MGIGKQRINKSTWSSSTPHPDDGKTAVNKTDQAPALTRERGNPKMNSVIECQVKYCEGK